MTGIGAALTSSTALRADLGAKTAQLESIAEAASLRARLSGRDRRRHPGRRPGRDADPASPATRPASRPPTGRRAGWPRSPSPTTCADRRSRNRNLRAGLASRASHLATRHRSCPMRTSTNTPPRRGLHPSATPPALPRDAAAAIFPQGLPGFPEVTRFRLERLARPARASSASQTADDPEFRFCPAPGRQPGADRGQRSSPSCGAVGLEPADVAVLLVVTRRCDPARTAPARVYVNRRAPLLVDLRRHLGFQVVLPRPDYAVRHPLRRP